MVKNERVLFISDMHIPYNHPDTIPFLKHLKRKYDINPESNDGSRVICLGDELDYHAISFHDSNPNLLSPSDELELAKKKISP